MSAKVNDLLEMIDGLTVAELVQVVEGIKDKYGVDPQPQAVAVAAAPAGDAPAEKTEFNVVLKDMGDNKIQVIKAVKDVLGLSLKDAKAMVESAPVALVEGVDKAKAEEVESKIKESGATISVE